MLFTREELLLITAIEAMPYDTWRTLVRRCGMSVQRAMVARESLLKARVIGKSKHDHTDMSGRKRPVDTLVVIADFPFLHTIREWLANRQQTPWPGPPARRPVRIDYTRVVPPPGIHHDNHERVLETILRNPTASWTSIRDASGVPSVHAKAARTYWEECGALYADAETLKSRDGRSYMRRKLLINENNTMVQEMRKRYGLKKPEPLDQEILRARELIRSTPAREGSPWRIEDVDTDRALHAKARVRRES